MSTPRVVSLLPASTEIICALGAGAQLVGRSHECDYPPEILGLPVCTSAKLDAKASSSEINRQIKTLGQESRSIYQLDSEKLRQLRPDIIVTQAQCDVCAIALADVERALENWPGRAPQIVSLSPERLADIWEDIRRVSEALELGEHGRGVLRALKIRVVDIIEKTAVMSQRASVACIEWIDPLMTAGNWVPELVELAGGSSIASQAGKHSAWMDWSSLMKADPEIIIAMPCGFDLKRTRAEMAALAKKPEWNKLRAVKKQRVFVTDGNAYFNRPGPRIVESLEILGEILHPERFNFGHKGKGWEKFA